MPPDIGVTGGEKLEQRLSRIGQQLVGQPTVRIGFLEGATYPDGTSVPLVAATQEFGSPTHNIPPRPFFRTMIKQHQSEWPGQIAKLLVRTGYDAERTLGLVGELIAGELRQSIRDLTSPPLAPATVKRKGFDKPLIDTGHMLASVDYEVTT